MKQELKSRFDNLEETRNKLFEGLKGISDKQLNQQPEPGQWSIAQVISHLLKSEQLSVLYMKKKLQYRNTLKNTGLKETFLMWLLKSAFNMPVKFKAPAIVTEFPDSAGYEELKVNWEITRGEIKEILESVDDGLIKKNFFKHAIIGKTNIVQFLEFLRIHIARHLKQIDRIKREVTV